MIVYDAIVLQGVGAKGKINTIFNENAHKVMFIEATVSSASIRMCFCSATTDQESSTAVHEMSVCASGYLSEVTIELGSTTVHSFE